MKYLSLVHLFLTFSLSAFAHLNPPQTINLLPPDANLENENKIDTLCPVTMKNVKGCREEKLKPKEWSFDIYELADEKSIRLGQILITSTPGKGLKAQFESLDKKKVNFPSDSTGEDLKKSPRLEFTIEALKAEWIQLPKRPFPAPVWMQLKKDWPRPSAMKIGELYSVGSLGSIMILKFTSKGFTYRKQNANDHLCGEAPVKIPEEELKEFTRPVEELFDKDGHLIAWPSIARGC